MRLAPGLLLLLSAALTTGRGAEEPPVYRSTVGLAPSARQLETLPRFDARWVIPAGVAAQLGPFFRQAGFQPELADELLARLGPGADASTRAIIPDRALLARFTPDERARWWEVLQLHHANEPYRWPLSLGPAELGALEREPRWRKAVDRLRALGRTHGDRLVFADLFALEDAFAGAADRAAFYRVALGGDALVLKLRRPADGPLDAAAAAAWWQVNGRYRAIEPLLNAVAAIPDSPRLDVTHVLPRLPRSLMNTFPPRLGEAEDPGVDSGVLASAFFALAPGVDLSAPGGLKAWLERECTPVEGPPRYGDVCVFGNLERSAWPYAAVYIADGVGFARRPTAFGAWQFLDLEDVGRLNPRFAGTPPRIFRPKSALVPPGEPPFLPGRMPEAWRKQLRLRPVPPGPWGRLWYYEVLLAPSGHTLERLPAPDRTPAWTFQGVSAAEIEAAIAEAPMPDAVRRDLRELFRGAAPDADGCVTVRPSLDLVLAVPREFRTRLFPRLVGGEAVTDYAQHIPFPAGFVIEEWFEVGSLPESVRQAVLRLAYPVGDRVMLSDFGALFSLLPTRREQLSAHRAALRMPAVVLLMEKPSPAEVPALAEYWRTGRAKDVGRLLESFAATGDDFRYLDVIHLLSPVEREFLNTYFTPDGPSLTPSCFWTAFNFGAEKPDDRYLVLPGVWTEHQSLAWQELTRDFDALPAPSRVGDIIAYRRKGAPEAVHVCVFIAEGIVFTKNGVTFSKPWHLSKLEDIDELYLTDPGMERVYFRRRP
ncbi:MAG TPA: hypothetical protein VEB66_17735 [Opitutaceae bacterium]|nr:hypothetical protein [Opitutaceae bacterium]